MAIKTYSGAGGVEAGRPNTKIRAEQVKSEDGFNSLAVDLEALRGQVKDIIGAANYKEEITGEYAKVQIVDLAYHMDAASGSLALSVKNDLAVAGAADLQSTLDVAGAADFSSTLAVAGKADFAGIVDVAMTLSASEIKIDSDVAQRLYIVGAAGEIKDEELLTFDGSEFAVDGDLAAANATLSADLSAVSGTFSGDVGMGDLTAVNGDFSGNLVVAGDFTVNGTTTTVNSTVVAIDDKSFVLAAGVAADSTANGAGIYVGADAGAGKLAAIAWSETDSKWSASEQLYAPILESAVESALYLKSNAAGEIISGSAADLVEGIEGQLLEGVGMHLDKTVAGQVTFSIGQAVETTSQVSFAGVTAYLTGSGLTSGKLLKNTNGLVVDASIDDFVNVGTGMTESLSGDVLTLSIGQSVDTSADVQFAKVFLDGNGASDAFIDTDGSDMLVLGYRDAAGTGAVSLPVAQAGNYTLSGFTATSIVGALNELKSAATAASKKAVYTNTGASEIAAATDIAGSVTWPGGSSFISELTGQNSLVFVNGMLMQAGGLDYTLNPGAGTLSFAFALQVGDVVVIQKA